MRRHASKAILKISGCIICILLSMSMVCHGQTVDSLTYRIQFGRNSSVVDTARAENASAISRFAQDLDSLQRSSEVEMLDISARGCASWEGNYTSNLYLSRQRARTVINFLKNSFDVDLAMKESYDFESEIIDLVSASGSDYSDKVLTILKSSDTNDKKILALKSLDSGRCWKWLNSSVFPLQRRVDVVIRYSVREKVITPDPPVQMEEPMKAEESVQVEEPIAPAAVAESADTVVTALADSVKSESSFYLAAKNNLIYDVALVANLGVEIGFGKHFSVDIPITYSPYTISLNYRMRTLSVQPDLRYYLKEGWRGHFFGIHGNFAYYNVVTPFNTRTRYQDRDGNHPLYGGGISYGYSLPFRKDSRWGVEFTIGAGYAYLDYDCFYNVDNGAWFTKDTKHYFGIDKAGITIYYRIVDKNRKKK